MISVSAYIMNFLTVSIQFFMGQGTLACFIFAALAGVTGVFCSWWTVYQSLYAALQTNGGSFAYGKYFIHKSISILWALWTFIAPPIGSLACFVAGLFVMIDQFSVGGSKGAVGGTLSIINMVLWGLVSPLHDQSARRHSCLLYTSPSPRDAHESRMPSSA